MLTGAEQCAARLAGLRARTEAALEGVLETAAAAARDSAAANAPVDSGALRDSIAVQRAGRLAYAVCADSEYAGAVELGTSRRAARPFMQPAMEAQRAALQARAAEAVRGALEG